MSADSTVVTEGNISMLRENKALLALLAAVTMAAIGLTLWNGLALVEKIARPPSSPVKQDTTWMLAQLPGTMPAHAGPRVAIFSDYYCPACQALHTTIQNLDAEWWEPSVVEWYHYPGAMDGAARHLAELVECAREQGRFAVAHNAAFDHAKTSRDLPSVSGFAGSIGISNVSSYASCMTEHRGRTAVDYQATVAHDLAVRGTPIVVVGASIYRGIPIKFEQVLAAAFSSRRGR